MSQGIGIIIKARKVCKATTLLSLYNSRILSYISYCIHVCGKGYDTHLNHVLVLQQKVLLVIADEPPRTNTDNLFVHFCIFPIKKPFVYTIDTVLYKYDNGMLPELFCGRLTPVNYIHNHETRQAKSQNLYVSFRPTFRGQKSFSGQWNFIMSKMDPGCSIGSFKNYCGRYDSCVPFLIYLGD